VAIVAPQAGTTRDVIEVSLDLGGYPVTLADTAGLREAGDAVEIEGVARALRRAASADLKLVLFDAATWPAVDATTLALVDDQTIPVVSRADLRPDAMTLGNPVGRQVWPVSVKTGVGLDELIAELGRRVVGLLEAGDALVPTRARHRHALTEAVMCLDRSLKARSPELAAEDLRLAVRAIGKVTGSVDVEEVLDRVFSEFCIGK
jgi:tRNA modification GTPase